VEVHPNGAQNGIEPVAHHPVEAVAVHSVLSLQVSDPGLDRLGGLIQFSVRIAEVVPNIRSFRFNP
jgi:hypothetical protein